MIRDYEVFSKKMSVSLISSCCLIIVVLSIIKQFPILNTNNINAPDKPQLDVEK
jgi:hypothetical protein